jgi:uncharacterized DUF497 family protein
MHPAQAEGFEWDDANVAHLAAHGIRPEEVEEVWLNGPVWVPNRRGRSGDWKMIGWTDAGRALTVVLQLKAQVQMMRAITGWDTTRGEQTRYLRGR